MDPMTDEEMQQSWKQVQVGEEEMMSTGAWVFSGHLHDSDTTTVPTDRWPGAPTSSLGRASEFGSRSTFCGVRLHPREVHEDTRLGPDDPRVMARSDQERVTWTCFALSSVIGHGVHSPRQDIARMRCFARRGPRVDGERHRASEGDVIVLPYGDPHRMGGDEPATCVPIFSLLNRPAVGNPSRAATRRWR
jgi:hypothetical protein